MYLKKLSLTNFKNYTQADYQFSDKINCFVGNNGVGKTNLMDAIHYLSFCKSYFNPIDSQNIRHQEDYFAINGTCIRNDDSTDHIQCILDGNAAPGFRCRSTQATWLHKSAGVKRDRTKRQLSVSAGGARRSWSRARPATPSGLSRARPGRSRRRSKPSPRKRTSSWFRATRRSSPIRRSTRWCWRRRIPCMPPR